MPTSRPRHLVTETEEIARALDDAAERWSEDRNRRSRLLVRLVEEGHRAVSGSREDDIASRRAAISRAAGSLTGMYEPDYLEKLRDDWPR